MAFTLTDDVTVEPLDDDLLILVPGRSDAWRLTGDQVEAFALARDGADEVPDHLISAMAGLVELGIVRTDTWSRRRVIQLGGAAAAAAVAAIALPGVAAAASLLGGTGTGQSTTTLPTRPDSLPISYLVVGGGGGGNEGGGGAGGVIMDFATIDLSGGPATLPVTVGAGGSAAPGASTVAGASKLGSLATALGGGRGGWQTDVALDGGSGGGGSPLAGYTDAGSGVPEQGSDGGPGVSSDDGTALGGGGGGYGGQGDPGTPSYNDHAAHAGDGAIGVFVPHAWAVGIGSPTAGWVGGGGGGSAYSPSAPVVGGKGGRGGGGDGYSTSGDVGSNGVDNTGGGGGGSNPGLGGSGLVIVSYPTDDAAGLTISGGDRTHTDNGTTFVVFTTVGSDDSFSVS